MPQRDSAPATRPAHEAGRLQVQDRPPGKLKPYLGNARTHDDEQLRQIRASIDQFGFNNPILLKDDEATIGAGHGRWEAALLEPPLETVPTITLRNLTDAQWRAYVIADNQLALNAGWDDAKLAAELDALVGNIDLALLGFDQAELDAIWASANATRSGLTDDDDAPEAGAIPTSTRGDLWSLGSHRLLVGDATDAADVARLMDGQQADLVWTDPPYNVAVEGAAGSIMNDHMTTASFRAFLDEAFASVHTAMRPGAVIYVAHAESERANFTTAFAGAGFKLSQVRIWVKHSATLSRNDFNWQHEPILYGWKEGAPHFFAGDFTLTTIVDDDLDVSKLKKADLRALVTEMRNALRSTVVRQDRPTRSDLHPTMKPVALIVEMIEASSQPGGLLLDTFGGSGSTMIAAEKTARRSRLMELDPRFADVIVRRWEQFTGRVAHLVTTGQSFTEVQDERAQHSGGQEAA